MSLARKIGALFNTSGVIDPSLYSSLPPGAMIPHGGATAPAGFLFAAGQAVSRTTYAALYAALGGASSPHGQGDGSTTFNVPDMRGRVAAGKDNMGGTAAGRLTTAGSGVDGSTLGAAGGAQSHVLTEAQMPSHTHGGSTNTTGDHTHGYTAPSATTSKAPSDSDADYFPAAGTTSAAGAHSHTLTINNTGGGVAHNNTQPTLVTNYIIKT